MQVALGKTKSHRYHSRAMDTRALRDIAVARVTNIAALVEDMRARSRYGKRKRYETEPTGNKEDHDDHNDDNENRDDKGKIRDLYNNAGGERQARSGQLLQKTQSSYTTRIIRLQPKTSSERHQ